MDVIDIMMAKSLSGGGGGGGTGGGDVFVVAVTATLDNGGAATYSTTVSMADVMSAVTDGKPVSYVLTVNDSGMVTQSTSYAVAAVPGYGVVAMLLQATDSVTPVVLYHTEDGISDQAPSMH